MSISNSTTTFGGRGEREKGEKKKVRKKRETSEADTARTSVMRARQRKGKRVGGTSMVITKNQIPPLKTGKGGSSKGNNTIRKSIQKEVATKKQKVHSLRSRDSGVNEAGQFTQTTNDGEKERGEDCWNSPSYIRAANACRPTA